MPFNNRLETPPGVKMSDYDVLRLLRRRQNNQPNALAQTQQLPKPVGYATTGIKDYIKPIYAQGDSRNVDVNAYQNDAQLEKLSGGDPNYLAALKAQREKAWGPENKAFRDYKIQQDLQLGDIKIQKEQLGVTQSAEDLRATQVKNIAEEQGRPLEQAKAIAQLRELENKATLSDMEIKRKRDLQVMLEQADQRAITPKAPADVAKNVAEMDTINTYPWPGWEAIKGLAQSHNVPNQTLYGMHLGRLAVTYNNPMQLVRDSGVKLPEDFATVKQRDVLDYYTDIATQWNKGALPDKALKNILAEIGVDKGSPKYAQTALAIAYGIQQRYAESGEDSLIKAQAAIAQSNADSLFKTAPKLAEVQANVSTADGVREFFVTPQKLLQTADIFEKSDDATERMMAVQLREKGLKQLGSPKSMSMEDIKEAVIGNMMQSFQGDPQTLSYLEAQLSPEDPSEKWQRDPKFDQFLAPIVPEFRKGAEDWELAEAKEQDRQDKIEKEATDKELTTRWDITGTKPTPIFFRTLEQAQIWDKLPSNQRQAYQTTEQDATETQLADPSYQMFLKLKDTERMDIRQKIELAKTLWKQQQADEKVDNIAMDSFKELGVTSIDQLPSAINYYSDTYGLGEVFQKEKEAGFWSSADWSVILKQTPTISGHVGMGNRPTEIERNTPDGRTAVFDANTKQFLRYK